jgi:hypothetical protein
MKRALILPIAVLSIASMAHATDLQGVIAPLRNQVRGSDYRAAGQIVEADAGGHRVAYAISVKGLWFAGALHTLIEIVPPKGISPSARLKEPMRLLLEMHPSGPESIRVFRPHQSAPTLLPFDEWGDRLLDTVFSYEDLLEPQYFWPDQTIVRNAVFGQHQCTVLKSTPGPSDRTEYVEVQTWLDRTIDYPVYAEKVMKQAGVVKEFTYYGLRQSSGVWSATQVEAKIRGRAGSTFLVIKRGSTKANLSANEFRPEQISHFEDHP